MSSDVPRPIRESPSHSPIPDNDRASKRFDLREHAPIVAALVGFAVTVACFYPGLLDPDSVAMLDSARQRRAESDVHSPFVIGAWVALDSVGLGVGTMLIAVAASFWTGVATIVRASPFGATGRAVGVLAIGLAPQVFAWLGVLNKDAILVGLLTLALGCAACFESTHAKRWGAAMLGLLVVASFIRHNAFLFTVPMASFVARGLATHGRWRFLAASLLLGVVIVVSARVVDHVLVDALGGRPGYPEQQITTQDLVAMSLDVGRVLLPHVEIDPAVHADGTQPARRPATLDDLRALYSAKGVVPLYWGAGDRIVWEYDRDRIRELRAAYLAAIVHHPRAYLASRIGIVGRLFGFGRHVCSAARLTMPENDLGLSTPTNWGFRMLGRIVEIVRSGPFFRSILWLAACAVGFARWRRGRVPAFVGFACAAALTYGLSFLVVSPVCSYRLMLPVVVVGEIATLFVIASWWQSRPPYPPRSATRSVSA